MIELRELFDIKNGQGLALEHLQKNGNIAFVARTSKNNGIVDYVDTVDEIEPFSPHAITVSLSGSVMESFYQDQNFYTAYHIKVLYPQKIALTKEQMLFYCMVLRANKFRYTFGRQANKTLDYIQIPSPEEIPRYINEIHIKKPENNSLLQKKIDLMDLQWNTFKYSEIFTICGGFYNKKPESSVQGDIPFIGAVDDNNGITSWHTEAQIEEATKDGKTKNHSIGKKIFEGNRYITISNNGSVGFAFYQPRKFTCSHDVTAIEPKAITFNTYTALFVCTIINLEKFRWTYGRKWRPNRMPNSLIKLPIDDRGEPNWQFMEKYIKSLPYSANLSNIL